MPDKSEDGNDQEMAARLRCTQVLTPYFSLGPDSTNFSRAIQRLQQEGSNMPPIHVIPEANAGATKPGVFLANN